MLLLLLLLLTLLVLKLCMPFVQCAFIRCCADDRLVMRFYIGMPVHNNCSNAEEFLWNDCPQTNGRSNSCSIFECMNSFTTANWDINRSSLKTADKET